MSDSALIPIRSTYAERIYRGQKRFEYRRMRPRKSLDYLVLYETGSKGGITGVVEVNGVLEGSPAELWALSKFASGIDYGSYRSYFKGAKRGVAYCLGRVWKLQKQHLFREIGSMHIPQSLQYIDSSLVAGVIKSAPQLQDAVGKRLFIGGVYGVGKTEYAQRISQAMNCAKLTASDFIEPVDDYMTISKEIKKIDSESNQVSLISKLSATGWFESGGILDGRFVLETPRGEMSRISESTFERLNIDGVVVLFATPEVIAERLRKRSGGIIEVNNELTSKIARIQDEEIRYAEVVSRRIGATFSKISNDF